MGGRRLGRFLGTRRLSYQGIPPLAAHLRANLRESIAEYTRRMRRVEIPAPIFTPDNEPYLGRHPLFVLDSLISLCMALNSKIAPSSHGRALSSLESALCVLIPQTISLSLSARELIRQGYLFGAKVLVRPITERAVTILYLWKVPAAISIWDDGWDHRKRPSLQKMLDELNQRMFQEEPGKLAGATHGLNSATHGDPFSARWNVMSRDDGVPVFPVAKNLSSPELADEVCAEVVPWLTAAMGIANAVFGQGDVKRSDSDPARESVN